MLGKGASVPFESAAINKKYRNFLVESDREVN